MKVIKLMINRCILPYNVIKKLGVQFASFPATEKEDYRREPIIQSDEEEWERYESLHGDEYEEKQNRELSYEEFVEKTWDKGDASGLVFYTDQFYWNQTKEEPSDVQDWDADSLENYKHPLASEEKNFKEFRKCIKDNERKQPIFECYNKAFGTKILVKEGWVPGSALKTSGIVEPIQPSDRYTRGKRGLGFTSDSPVYKDLSYSHVVIKKQNNSENNDNNSNSFSFMKFRKVHFESRGPN
ncbi:G patch domain-containing protein 3-like [Zophobas morio]|uniref:G patch domain-containing protein 3-like n=1 Tax=Zophobas morio TaxID=2755281 RepID=UPI003082F5C0